jgi:hypothetical protein
LTTLATSWPTPDAAISNDGGEDPETFRVRRDQQKARAINGNGMGTPLATAAKLWPTPISRDHRSIEASGETREKNARPLSELVGQWSTPRSSDAEKGSPNQQFGSGGIPLPAQAAQWMTPRVSESGQYQYKGAIRTSLSRPCKAKPRRCHWPFSTPTVRSRRLAKSPRTFAAP